MRKPLYPSVLATTMFITGSFLVFRGSPWQSQAHSLKQAQTTAYEPGYYEYDKETAKLYEENKRMAHAKEGILSLADEKTAQKLHIRPEVQKKAREILKDLEKRTDAKMEEALQEWRQKHPDQKVGTPAFMTPHSNLSFQLEDWKIRAEQQVFDLLNPKEQQAWIQSRQSPIAHKMLVVANAE